jgi:hypothetical protein
MLEDDLASMMGDNFEHDDPFALEPGTSDLNEDLFGTEPSGATAHANELPARSVEAIPPSQAKSFFQVEPVRRKPGLFGIKAAAKANPFQSVPLAAAPTPSAIPVIELVDDDGLVTECDICGIKPTER